MISIGTNIRSSADQLKRSTVESVTEIIRNPPADTALLLRQLRVTKDLDKERYTEMKKLLPYIVCAVFNPPFRKTENFAYTEFFIMDIDHISEQGQTAENVRKLMSADPRTALAFVSPGGDGVKVMMKLQERCYDAALYRVFYKTFISKFAVQYNLRQVIDPRTCDVTRACFLSNDKNVYYNPYSEPVNLKDFIDAENDIYSALKQKKETDELLRSLEHAEEKEMIEKGLKKPDPDKDTLDKIRATLNPKAKPVQPHVYVPHILDDIMDDLKTFVEEKGITVTEVRNIQYAKKIRFELGRKQAEINLFYGKRGFTVVESPRTGTDPELNSLMADVINAFIAEIY